MITHEYRKSRVLFAEYLRRKTLEADIHVLLQISSSTTDPFLIFSRMVCLTTSLVASLLRPR